MTLLQGFGDGSERSAKRRKLEDGATTAQLTAAPTEPTPAEEDEDEDEDGDKDVDLADESEEEPEAGVDEVEAESDNEDEEDASDPFDSHFTTPDADLTGKRVKAIQKNDWSTKKVMTKVSKAVVMHPNVGGGNENEAKLPSPVARPENLKLKHKLRESVLRKMTAFDGLQQALAPMVFNYHDILFSDRNVSNADGLRQITCLHAVNHVLK